MKDQIKVEQIANENQFMIETKEEKVFQSYASTIAIYSKENRKLTLGKDWGYSKTTMKHLYIFIDEHCCLKEISEALYFSKNKRKTISKLIEDCVINYDNNLQ